MSIVSSFASPEAARALRRSRALSSVLSLFIAILAVVLVGAILALVLLPVFHFAVDPVVTYSAPREKEEVVDRPEVTPQVQRQPSAPSSAMAKVIASTTPSPTTVPVPDVAVPDPSLDFGSGDDFGKGWGGSGDGFGSGGTTFFGQSVKADRIAYVIDFSLSMRGQGREKLLRRELTDSVGLIPHRTKYALIFFAGPAWVAGDDVDWNKKGATVVAKGGRKFKWKSQGKANDWQHDGKKEPVGWLDATEGQLKRSNKTIRETRLVWGTRWDNPLEMALSMDPAPQEIYFMTDGAARGSKKWADEVGAKARSRGIKINCIAMMQPKAHDDMKELAKRSGGQFTIVMKDGTRKKVR